jgi:acyl-CoA thioesterase FadM
MDIDFNNPPLGLFVYRTETHFDVLDAQWLMHHSRQIRYMERAQQAMFDHIMGVETFDPWRFPDMNVVVRKLDVDFIQGLLGVRPFMITLRAVQLRASALTTQIELRSEDGAEVYTKAKRTVCKIGFEKQEPQFWTDEFRERYTPWVKAGKKLEL